ncbi:MAG: Uma2 family endonuclease [Acidobacteriota bacterium]
MAPQTSIKLTYEDFAAIPDDGRRHEIIDGEHYVNPAPNLRHQTVSIRLASALFSFVREHALGHVFAAPCDVLLTPYDIVEPDVIYVSNANARLLTESNIQGVPDLLVEILSSNRRHDKRVKFDRYERAGVPEYWIVDPDDDVVEVYRQSAGRFVRADIGDTLSSPLLPGFVLSVRELFE